MALDMSPEQKAIGKTNFHRAVGKLSEPQPGFLGMTRRRFMQGLAAAGATLPIGAAAYFGYNNSRFANRPVKAGLIGAGDEGGVLVGEHNPAYLQFIAYSDIRPSSKKRIFEDERLIKGPANPRKGFKFHYGNRCDQSGSDHYIRAYDDYKQLLNNPDIEAVVIAVPLHLHFQVVMDALDAGKQVLCEKLMAWNIRQCKTMVRKAKAKDRFLAIGHQRHYSMLYAHAVEAVQTGMLGDIRHIRAQWHRNNARPKLNPDGSEQTDPDTGLTKYQDSWRPDIQAQDKNYFANRDLRPLGFDNLNQLIRWRLYQKTGGGLMAELGSHQLDACSIFLGKRHPLAVFGTGGKHFYKDDREVEDHVYCTFQFPGDHFDRNARHHDGQGRPLYNDIVTVTYSSISTNAFEPYGECVMGSKGTLVVDSEQSVMLWGQGGRSTAVTVAAAGGRPVIDSSASMDAPREALAVQQGRGAIGPEPVSRGYREEMEHFAYCIRMKNEGMARDQAALKPRCDGAAALADAVMALAANHAIRQQDKVAFNADWFNADSNVVPDWDPRAERAEWNPRLG